MNFSVNIQTTWKVTMKSWSFELTVKKMTRRREWAIIKTNLWHLRYHYWYARIGRKVWWVGKFENAPIRQTTTQSITGNEKNMKIIKLALVQQGRYTLSWDSKKVEMWFWCSVAGFSQDPDGFEWTFSKKVRWVLIKHVQEWVEVTLRVTKVAIFFYFFVFNNIMSSSIAIEQPWTSFSPIRQFGRSSSWPLKSGKFICDTKTK